VSAGGERLPLRSLLFVPGDSERKQAKGLASDADALILDLEDSVSPPQLAAARAHAARLLGSSTGARSPQLWLRVNGPTSGLLRQDLESVCTQGMPDGVVLPKISAAEEIAAAAAQLAALELKLGVPKGATRIVVIATETPRGLLALPQSVAALAASPEVALRIAGLTWGAEDLSAALGALAKRDAAGDLTFTFQVARAACLLAAGALGVQAIDGVYTDFRNAAGLERELEAARRDGFSGKLAIHPDQIRAINMAFTPSDAEREHAQRVVAAFAAAPGAGVVSLDGQMIDRPHLLQAQRILATAHPKARA